MQLVEHQNSVYRYFGVALLSSRGQATSYIKPQLVSNLINCLVMGGDVLNIFHSKVRVCYLQYGHRKRL